MRKKYKKFANFFSLISVILLVALVIPTSSNMVKGASSDHGKLVIYSEAAEEIIQIVNKNIITLPMLEMISNSIISNVVSKLDKYSIFVNDYTNTLSAGGLTNQNALFDDLISGYQASRKFIYLIKDVDNIASSAQTAYTLINTVDGLLDQKKGQLSIYIYNDFNSNLQYFKEVLDQNNILAQDLILETISKISLDRDYYSDDIVELLSLREELKEIKNSHLSLSEDIIEEAEDIVRVIESGASSDHGI